MIEGVADGLAGAARLAGGAPADDPSRRRSIAVGGYAITAVLSGLIGAAGSVWQVGALRAGAWAARGLRVPARNALLADVVPAAVSGLTYGFKRAIDNLGAIGGPLFALALVGLIGVRSAILPSIIPGLLAALAIIYAIRRTALPTAPEPEPIRLRVRPLLHGQLGRLLAAAFAFELGNLAATLLILRATELLQPGRSHTSAAQLALVLYTGYNLAATLASIPAGQVGDRHGLLRILAGGAACFLIAYVGFAFTGESFPLLAGCFILAGLASAAPRPRRPLPSPNSLPTSSAAPRSDSWPHSKPSATSPPAQSRESSGPQSHRPRRSPTSPPGWRSPWPGCFSRAYKPEPAPHNLVRPSIRVAHAQSSTTPLLASRETRRAVGRSLRCRLARRFTRVRRPRPRCSGRRAC